MSHMVFQAAQTIPSIIPTPKTLIHRRVLTIHTPAHWSPPSSSFISYKALVLRALLAPAPVDGDVKVGLERCLRAPTAAGFDSPSTSSAAVTCGPGDKGKSGGGGGGGGGSATLERPKADSAKKKKKKGANFVPETDTGGGSDDGGKHLTHGGGDGGDDDSDDDDYFDDFDEGDEGHEGWVFRRRFVLAELFDRRFVDAVLSEWQRTLMDLPAGMIEAYKEGLVSSAQMVKFLAINARPTTTRFISRALPEAIYGEFIGRMIADPAFLYRLFLEQTATIGCCVWSELNNRKERIKQEWDLALLNVLTVTACNAIVVWSLAPCRSYSTGQMLPNNVFERSYPCREFDLAKRIISFFHKASHLCMVGFTAGAAQGAMSNFCASKKEGRLSVSIPTVSSNALGYGVFLGLYANFRYQLLCGIDHAMINYFDVVGVPLFFSSALRIWNVQLGETQRLAWLGVEVDPLNHSNDTLKDYNRPLSDPVTQPSSNWSMAKNAIVLGLGLLGIKHGQVGSPEGASPPPTARRKKIVKRKMATSSA